MTPARIAAAVALVAAAAAFAAFARPDQALSAEEPEAGITVNGIAVVSAVPDRALFWFGVQSEGRTASAAMNANAAEMRRVVDALRSAGVAAADLQTQNVSLSPRTNESGDIVGYTAVNNVSARIRNLAPERIMRKASLVDGSD